MTIHPERTWVEIRKDAIAHNFALFKKQAGDKVIVAPVVKSNAYGHDLVLFSKELVSLGVQFLCVDDVNEATALRESGISVPILVFAYVPKSGLKGIEGKNISVTVANFDALRDALEANIPIHIKIESGLGRQGFLLNDREKVFSLLTDKTQLEGLYSHLAAAEHPKRKDYNISQKEILEDWKEYAKGKGYTPMVHIAGSAATMMWKDFHLDMVRVGISMYGLWSSESVHHTCGDTLDIQPVLSWKAVISEVKELPKGHNIGYDLTATLARDSRIAVVPVGYWHGYDRRLSNKGRVFIKDNYAPILGRVAMDMIVIDVTDCNDIQRGDVVELIGPHISADEIAKLADTINYEIVTKINPEIKRILI